MANYNWNNKTITINNKEYAIRFKNVVSGGGYAVLQYGNHELQYSTEASRHGYKYVVLHNANNYDKRTIARNYDYVKNIPKKWIPIFKTMFNEVMEISEDFYKRNEMR